MIDERFIPPMERQYGALGTHLAAQHAAGLTHCTLSFGAIEVILGRPLPATARSQLRHRQWWRSDNAAYPHGWYGWQRVGWTVAAVDLAAETVTFSRTGGAV